MKQVSSQLEKVAKNFKTKFSKGALSKVIGGGWINKNNKAPQQEQTRPDPISSPVAGQNVSKLKTDEYTSLSEGGSYRLFRGDGAANILAKTINFMQHSHEQMKELREIENDFKKEKHESEEHAHMELMKSLGVKNDKKDSVKYGAGKGYTKDNGKGKRYTKDKGKGEGDKKKKPKTLIEKALRILRDYAPAVGVAAGEVLNTYDKVVDTFSPKSKYENVIKLVGIAESGGDYNQMNIVGKGDVSKVVKGNVDVTTNRKFTKNLTEMTIPEVVELGERRGETFKKLGKDGKWIKSAGKAAGAYQFMPDTLLELAKKKYPHDWKTKKFDKQTQEELQKAYLENLINAIKTKHQKVSITPQILRFGQMVGQNSQSIDRFALATDDQLMSSVLSPRESASNEKIASKTVGEYRAELSGLGLTNIPIQEELITPDPVAHIDNSTYVNNVYSTRNFNVTQETSKSGLPSVLKKEVVNAK